MEPPHPRDRTLVQRRRVGARICPSWPGALAGVAALVVFLPSSWGAAQPAAPGPGLLGSHGPAAPSAQPAPAAPQPAAPPDPERVPLDANYSPFELGATAFAVITGPTLLALGPRLFGSPVPSIGPPAEGSFDRKASDRLHLDGGGGGRFLAGVPDKAGIFVLPYLPALWYGAAAGGIWFGDGPVGPERDVNADHRFVAYAEALGWTTFATGATKLLVGRERPYVVLDRPELAGSDLEARVSFFSGHSSAMFCAASFVALDASDRLRAGRFAAASPGVRFLLGTLTPYAVAYGAASLVAVSRVIDQQHFASDVIVGAMVGTLASHLAFVAHFDDRGRPRWRRGRPDDVPGTRIRIVPLGVASDHPTFGVGLLVH